MKPVPAASWLPCTAGIGLRGPHYRQVLEEMPDLGWVEVHSENFFGSGADLRFLQRVREHYPVSLHGVGIGLVSPLSLDEEHLAALKRLCDLIEPAAVSEHLSWNRAKAGTVNDLLPFPYTWRALERVAERIHRVQECLGCPLGIENLSSYLAFPQSEMGESQFMAELSRRTGCFLILDVNNLYVNSWNLGVDIEEFLQAIPVSAVGELHLAGHDERDGWLVDTHGSPVSAPVWDLYQRIIEWLGPRPVLLERDQDIPALEVLLEERGKALALMEETHVSLA